MNVQFAIKDGTIFVLEVNPRASRTVPFVAKVIGKPLAKIASRVSGLGQGASGLAIFTLENGQVWRQLSSADVVVARVGDRATVSRGAFSSFWLELGSGRGCKVGRVL